MSADDPTASSDDNPRTLPDRVAPAVVISRHQIEYWAGHVPTSGELARLDARIATSPIPQVIAQIVSQFYHRTDQRDHRPGPASHQLPQQRRR